MSAPAFTACEVETSGGWKTVTAEEAHLRHRSDRKRCPACHGQVVTKSTYGGRAKVFLSHHRAHEGCPFDPKRFTGTATPHPKALV